MFTKCKILNCKKYNYKKYWINNKSNDKILGMQINNSFFLFKIKKN